jgi:hypothetical protein
LKEGDCTNEKLVSLLKGDDSEAKEPNNTADTAKLKSTKPDEVKKSIDSSNSTDTGTKTQVMGAVTAPEVTVKVCTPKQGVYSSHVSPGVPIAFSAIPIVFDSQTNLPKAEQGDLEALHKALEKPDNQ